MSDVVEKMARLRCMRAGIDPDAPQVVGECGSGKMWQFEIDEVRADIDALAESVTDEMALSFSTVKPAEYLPKWKWLEDTKRAIRAAILAAKG